MRTISAATFRPACTRLSKRQLADRVARAVAELADCHACPRDCGVDRLAGKWAACKTGRHAIVGSWFAHFGEEDCLRGWNGSGTIFFAHCNLRCVFCQNFDISQGVRPQAEPGSPPGHVARMMLELQRRGCHNINFVTPEHVVPQMVEALAIAVEQGLNVPVVYNTSAYDAVRSLQLIDGLIDIYMPDFKFWSAERSRTYMKAADYPDAARAAIREMHRQVGALVLGEDGLARRGLIVRHLVMPGCLEETRAILEWIAAELGTDTYVNLMDQYYPAGSVGGGRFVEIDRRLRTAEFAEAEAIARRLGLRNLDERRPHARLRARLP
jgi:putative pyruvate formate lyase activating enzyme